MADTGDVKSLRYRVMLALYLPILLYSFSTFDVDEGTVIVEEVTPVLVDGSGTIDEGTPTGRDTTEAVPIDSIDVE